MQSGQEQISEQPSSPYSLRRIGWELERTALGDGFYDNALRVAMDLPLTSSKDREVLQRFSLGKPLIDDVQSLLDIALRVYRSEITPYHIPATVGHATAWMKNGVMVNCFPRRPATTEEWLVRDRDQYWSQKGYSERPLFFHPPPTTLGQEAITLLRQIQNVLQDANGLNKDQCAIIVNSIEKTFSTHTHLINSKSRKASPNNENH